MVGPTVLQLLLFCFVIVAVVSVPRKNDASKMISYTSDMKICQLRNEMKYEDISAYIVIDGDDHQMKHYVHPRDKRREWLTNYQGQDAIAIVTQEKAAIWVPQKCWREAERSLSADWILMRVGSPTTMSIEDWLIRELSPGDKVSTDSIIIDYVQAQTWKEKLSVHNIVFAPLASSYVDMIWKNAPTYNKDPLCVLSNAVAGKSSADKLREIRQDMAALDTDLYVVTALDEIAWITNLLGTDYPHLPLFRAYMIIGKDFASLYVSREKQSQDIERALALSSITMHDYDIFWHHLQNQAKGSRGILLPKAYSTSKGVSYEVYVSVPEHKIKWAISPALLRKDKKNNAEATHIRQTHLTDAIRYVKMMMNIENTASSTFNATINETEFMKRIVKTTMKKMSEKPKNYIYHYNQKDRGNAKLESFTLNYLPSNDSSPVPVPLLTMTSNCRHYVTSICMARTLLPVNGLTPSQKQVSVYTALLAGTIDLIKSIFSCKTSVKASDFILRAHLFKMGLHWDEEAVRGFGLIMGSFEAFKETYELDVFRTENIGYVEENKWVMRLGNVITVVPANTTFQKVQNLMSFEMITLLPFEKGLIDIKRLTNSQLFWLNRYHRMVRAKVGGELYRTKDFTTYEWLVKKTAPITRGPTEVKPQTSS